jgi:signal transduction histidine kinase/ActR/RegA family two-component response regulator
VRAAGIVHVEIIEDGEARLKLDRATPPRVADHSWEVPLLRPGTNQRIGTLRISENYDDIRAELARRGGVLVVTELTKILAASILLFVVVYFVITRPLAALAEKVQSNAAHGGHGTIAIKRVLHRGRDEIDALVDAINTANAEQRQLQAREASAGRMEALGRLAGGIAHDFNNILGSILGFAGLIKQDLPQGSEDRRFAERILAASDRGKALIDQIRTFALAGVVERQLIDLSRVLKQNEAFLSASLPPTTRTRIEPGPAGLTVYGSEALIGQAIVNLCINASEAMGGREGDVIVAITRANKAEVAELAARAAADGERFFGTLDPEQDYALIKVTDTADGIADDVLDRMFEPFFTTKGRDRGTGLGLAVVRGVVESHNGACRVKTRIGMGTEVSLYLPLQEGMAKQLPASRTSEDGDMPRGKERILLVDDEADLVDMLTVGLTRLGYESVAVTDPREALEAVQEAPSAWDIVITDEVMPEMRGMDLIRRIKAIRPDILTVLCTGYSDSDEIAHADCVDIFLLKPIDADGIAQHLRAVIDSRMGMEQAPVP